MPKFDIVIRNVLSSFAVLSVQPNTHCCSIH